MHFKVIHDFIVLQAFSIFMTFEVNFTLVLYFRPQVILYKILWVLGIFKFQTIFIEQLILFNFAIQPLFFSFMAFKVLIFMKILVIRRSWILRLKTFNEQILKLNQYLAQD
jgi:hypothetical protein